MAKINAASFFGSSTTSSSIASSGGGTAASQTVPSSTLNSSKLIQIINEYQSIVNENKERTKVDVGLIGSIRGLMSSMSLITSNLFSLRKTVTDHLKAHSALLKTKKPKPSYFESTIGDSDRPGGWSKSPEKLTGMTSPLGDMTKTTGLIAAATAGIMGAIASLQGPRGPGDTPSGPGLQGLSDFIAKAETGGRYDAFAGDKGTGDPNIPKMTLNQLLRKYPDTAVGAHQFKPSTAIGLAKKMGLNPESTVFTPEVQKQLNMFHLKDLGYDKMKKGEMSQKDFGRAVSQQYRAVPDPYTGKTYGDQYAKDNSATVTLDQYNDAIERSRSDNLQSSSSPSTPKEIASNPGRTPDSSSSEPYIPQMGDVQVASAVEPSTKTPTPNLKLDESGKVAMMPFPIPSPQPAPMQPRPQFEPQNSGSISPTDPKGSYIAGSLRIGSYVALG